MIELLYYFTVSPYIGKLALKKFEKRVMDYNYHMNEAMASLPRVIYRCEVHSPVRGNKYILKSYIISFFFYFKFLQSFYHS